ncbi:hypothetical protein MASR2M70_00930 [Bacillota bacterium]
MKCYNAAIFDLGMTLIYPPMSGSFLERLEEFGGTAEKKEIRRALSFVDRHFMNNYPGYINRDVKEFYTSYASMVFAYLHITDIPVKAFSAAMMEKSPPRSEWRTFADALPCLDKLKEQGNLIGLLTNWDIGARDLLKSMDLYHYFDSIVVSAEINAEKPEPEGFLQSLKNLNVEPGNALYVGDNFYDDITGANNVGIRALLVERWGNNKYPKGNYERISNLAEVAEFCCKGPNP